MNLLSVENLVVRYQAIPAVAEVSFSVGRQETVGLIGESGSGKSTILNAILGMLRGGGVATGQVLFEGQDLLRADPTSVRALLGRRISVVPQAAQGALNPMLRVGAQISELVRTYSRVPRPEAWEASVHLLDRVGLQNPRDCMSRFPHQISGGQAQRVLIAMALCGTPDLVLADEPTTALDVTVQRRILDLIRDLQGSYGFGLLFVTHHLALLPGLASKIVVMRKGRVVEQGATEKIVHYPTQDYTKSLLSVAKEAEERDPTSTVKQDLKSDAPQLVLHHVSVKHTSAGLLCRNRRRVLDDVSFNLPSGACLAIVGESGAGKTTVCRAMMGLAAFTGKIEVAGFTIDGSVPSSRKTLREHIQMVFQDSDGALNPSIRIRDILSEPIWAKGKSIEREQLAKALVGVDLPEEFLERFPGELSGGQRQRIAIARGLISSPTVLILDEPLSSLDIATQRGLLELLKRTRSTLATTMVVVSHDMDVVRSLADYVLVLQNGRVAEIGEVGRIFDTPRHSYTQELLQAVPRLFERRPSSDSLVE